MADPSLIAESVGEYYDEWTDRYQSSFGDTFQACRPTNPLDLHRYVMECSGIRGGERILDAGCGICGPSLYFAKHRDVLIDAVTISRVQVATGNRRVAEAGLDSKIKVHLADFQRLNEYFPESTFDRVLFLESFCHSADPGTTLRGVFKVLKPGGVVYIKDFFEKQCDTEVERRLVRKVVDRVHQTFLCRAPRIRDTVELLKLVGFRQQTVEPVKFSPDHSIWRHFNEAHEFDLYDGQTPYEWSDWLSLRFEKPMM